MSRILVLALGLSLVACTETQGEPAVAFYPDTSTISPTGEMICHGQDYMDAILPLLDSAKHEEARAFTDSVNVANGCR